MKRSATKLVMLTGIMSAFFSINALAGWRLDDSARYWWDNGDGTYPVSQWQWLDGNLDGISECYYFDEQGYMLRDTTTPDGYMVNSEGTWVVDGVIQTIVDPSAIKENDAENSAEAATSDSAQETAPSVSHSLGALGISPDGEFYGCSVSKSNQSLTLINADSTRTAVILYTDMSQDPDYKAVMDSAQSLGIDMNSDIMKSMIMDTFVNSFTSTMGSQPLSVTDSIYPSGSWRQLRYSPETTSGTYTDVFIKYDNNAFYSIIFGGVGNYADVAYFMNNCVL